MSGPRTVSDEEVAVYKHLRSRGISRREAAARAEISYSSAQRIDKGLHASVSPSSVSSMRRHLETLEAEPPKAYEDLSPEARLALDDFAYFRKRYLGRAAKPWQEEAAKDVVGMLSTELKEWVVVNVPPGSGKSTTFTHDIPAWLICRNRAIRGMIGSKTQKQANQYGRRLRATLERSRPVEGAEATLMEDFGAFKPLESKQWRSEEFIVWESADEFPSDEKEATIMCAGMDTGFLGGRFDFVIWDDLVDSSTIRTAEARHRQQEWFDDEAESRLEPGGLFILQGQRLAAQDLYHHALVKEGPTGHGSRKYRHIIYPAHDVDRCENQHGPDAKPWPDGCLLDPERLGWSDLETLRRNNPRRFEVLYQQKDVDPAGQLVQQLWIDGGEEDGLIYPGCLDRQRVVAQLPATDLANVLSVISVDPSPTRWWSIQWWLYDPRVDTRWLIDMERSVMSAPDFLDRNESNQHTGLLELWSRRAIQLGAPISHLVVERNAAQRFMLQYDHMQQWLGSRGVDLIPHNTHATNKNSTEFGVQTIGPLYRFGKVSLPWGDEQTMSRVQPLIDELLTWPGGSFDDCVMAHWMMEWNLAGMSGALNQLPQRPNVPSWLQKG